MKENTISFHWNCIEHQWNFLLIEFLVETKLPWDKKLQKNLKRTETKNNPNLFSLQQSTMGPKLALIIAAKLLKSNCSKKLRKKFIG